jgi:hypothetical protein
MEGARVFICALRTGSDCLARRACQPRHPTPRRSPWSAQSLHPTLLRRLPRRVRAARRGGAAVTEPPCFLRAVRLGPQFSFRKGLESQQADVPPPLLPERAWSADREGSSLVACECPGASQDCGVAEDHEARRGGGGKGARGPARGDRYARGDVSTRRYALSMVLTWWAQERGNRPFGSPRNFGVRVPTRPRRPRSLALHQRPGDDGGGQLHKESDPNFTVGFGPHYSKRELLALGEPVYPRHQHMPDVPGITTADSQVPINLIQGSDSQARCAACVAACMHACVQALAHARRPAFSTGSSLAAATSGAATHATEVRALPPAGRLTRALRRRGEGGGSACRRPLGR